MLWAMNDLFGQNGSAFSGSKDGCSCTIIGIQRWLLGLKQIILSLRPLLLAAELTHEEHRD